MGLCCAVLTEMGPQSDYSGLQCATTYYSTHFKGLTFTTNVNSHGTFVPLVGGNYGNNHASKTD